MQRVTETRCRCSGGVGDNDEDGQKTASEQTSDSLVVENKEDKM
jgi:hypothetical protein